MKLTIKGRPIPKKNRQRIVRAGKRLIPLPSKAYENFKELAGWQIKSQWKKKPIKERIYLKLNFEIKGKYHVDLDNLVSSCCDILEDFYVIENDDQVVEIYASKKGNYPDWITRIEIIPLTP